MSDSDADWPRKRGALKRKRSDQSMPQQNTRTTRRNPDTHKYEIDNDGHVRVMPDTKIKSARKSGREAARPLKGKVDKVSASQGPLPSATDGPGSSALPTEYWKKRGLSEVEWVKKAWTYRKYLCDEKDKQLEDGQKKLRQAREDLDYQHERAEALQLCLDECRKEMEALKELKSELWRMWRDDKAKADRTIEAQSKVIKDKGGENNH